MEKTDKLVLGYWGIRGLAERIRLLLEYLEIPYVDKRINDREEWFNKIKPELEKHNPFINLPYLQDGDKFIAESDAILLYIIQKSGRLDLFGASPEVTVDVAQVRGVFGDLHSGYIRLMYGSQNFEADKPAFFAHAKKYLHKIETFLGNKEWLCGNLTLVDFIVAEFLNVLNMFEPSLVEGFPGLTKLHQKFWALPQIAKYVSEGRFIPKPLNGPSAKWNGE